MSCRARDSDVNSFFLFTTKSARYVGTTAEKDHCTIQKKETDVIHVVEVRLQTAGSRDVKVTGITTGKCATFDNPGVGSGQTSWEAPANVTASSKFGHVRFEHCSSGFESISVRIEELNLFQNPPTFQRVDQGGLAFQITLA
jgi:hypothetical protein